MSNLQLAHLATAIFRPFQPIRGPMRYLIHGAYPRHLFAAMDKIWISCTATEDPAADRKTLHELSRVYRDVEMSVAKLFGIPCIRYEAWLLVISMEFVHGGVWMGLI